MMKKSCIVFLIGLCMVACRQQDAPDIAVCNVVWDSQSENALGSMPIGNGDIGANVWVSTHGDLLFYISKTDSWSENGTLLKIGRLKVSFTPDILSSKDFRQELDLATGTIKITGRQDGKTLSLAFWVDANAPVVHLDGESSIPIEMTVSYDGWRRSKRQLHGEEIPYGIQYTPHPVFMEADTILCRDNSLVWCHHNRYSIWKETLDTQSLGDFADNHEDPLLHLASGALVKGEGLKNLSSETLSTTQAAKKIDIQICVLTEKAATPDDWANAISRLSAETEKTPPARRKADHDAYWRNVWDSHYILVDAPGDSLRVAGVRNGYTLQRFINLCSGKGRMPIKFNGNIFNVDSVKPDRPYDADYRAWGGCFWWQNTRLPYFAMLYAGDFSLMKTLFGMYMDALPMAKFQTERYYGFDGAYFPETIYFWGTMNNNNYGWSRAWTDNSIEGSKRTAEEGQPARLSENRYIRYLWEGGIELTSLMLDYYDFTGNKAFLNDTVLPFAKEIATFYSNRFPKGDDGKILFYPSQALETYWDIANPMTEVAGFRSVLPRLLRLDETPAEDKKLYSDMFAAMPELPMREENGEKFLEAGEKLHGRTNVESPELYAIFPYQLFGLGKPSLDIAKRSYENRLVKDYFGWHQAGIFAAMIGESEEAARIVTDNFNTKHKESRFPAFWGPNYDWVPDQDHGNSTMRALQNMLIQTSGDTILLFPAWDLAWDVRFKVWAPGNTSIEGELKDGAITRLHVVPEQRKKDIIIQNEHIKYIKYIK